MTSGFFFLGSIDHPPSRQNPTDLKLIKPPNTTTHRGITMIDAEELRYRALETQGMLDEMEWLKEQGEYSILTPVEHRVVLGLIMQVIKEVGDYNIDFITKMQDLLVLVGFSTDKVMEIMTQHLNPNSSLFNSPEIQGALSQNSDNSYEYN
jgi:hypothetical protein